MAFLGIMMINALFFLGLFFALITAVLIVMGIMARMKNHKRLSNLFFFIAAGIILIVFLIIFIPFRMMIQI